MIIGVVGWVLKQTAEGFKRRSLCARGSEERGDRTGSLLGIVFGVGHDHCSSFRSEGMGDLDKLVLIEEEESLNFMMAERLWVEIS
jgi:hypothetical protein